MKVLIEKSRKGYPVIGVGGGACSNTFKCRFVIDGKTGNLKKAIFVKTTGKRSCRLDQAIVPLEVGDVICEMWGRRPVTAENPDICMKALKIIGFGTEISGSYAEVEDITDTLYSPFEFPSVVRGANIYHNRNGAYFCTIE